MSSWLFGTWNVTMRFDGDNIPLGEEFVPERMLRSVRAISTSETVSFPLRFYSTLPNTAENTLRVRKQSTIPHQSRLRCHATALVHALGSSPSDLVGVVRQVSLGQMPLPQVVPDRAYNTRSVINAYYGKELSTTALLFRPPGATWS